MRNRPGRIYYMLDFDGLGPGFVREYCQDNLKNKDNTEKVVQVSGLFSQFNFDLLKAMVEEMNRYNETPAQVLKFLNARPSFDLKQSYYSVRLRDPTGQVYSGRKDGMGDWSGNPLSGEVQIRYLCRLKADGKTQRRTTSERFNATDLVGMKNDTGAYIFKNKRGFGAVLTPRQTEFEVNFDTLPLNGPSAKGFSNEDDMEGAEQAWVMDSTEDESVGDY